MENAHTNVGNAAGNSLRLGISKTMFEDMQSRKLRSARSKVVARDFLGTTNSSITQRSLTESLYQKDNEAILHCIINRSSYFSQP